VTAVGARLERPPGRAAEAARRQSQEAEAMRRAPGGRGGRQQAVAEVGEGRQGGHASPRGCGAIGLAECPSE
jgi:hypothetical protein